MWLVGGGFLLNGSALIFRYKHHGTVGLFADLSSSFFFRSWTVIIEGLEGATACGAIESEIPGHSPGTIIVNRFA